MSRDSPLLVLFVYTPASVISSGLWLSCICELMLPTRITLTLKRQLKGNRGNLYQLLIYAQHSYLSPNTCSPSQQVATSSFQVLNSKLWKLSLWDPVLTLYQQTFLPDPGVPAMLALN